MHFELCASIGKNSNNNKINERKAAKEDIEIEEEEEGNKLPLSETLLSTTNSHRHAAMYVVREILLFTLHYMTPKTHIKQIQN